MTVGQLLHFYGWTLRQYLPEFNPEVTTTRDIVHGVIIPVTGKRACSYATYCSLDDEFPTTMVTHNWDNLFRDLIAAVVADALEDDEDHTDGYAGVAKELATPDGPMNLLQKLQSEHKTDKSYWICALRGTYDTRGWGCIYVCSSFEGHVSSVSTPIFATKYSLFSIRDLQ